MCKLIGDNQAAEDIVQDFFCSLWINHEKLPEIVTPRFYLYRSVHNRSLNWLKKNRTIPISGLEFNADDDILANMIEEEVIRKLHNAITNHLPNKCREVFMLKLLGMKNAKIATALHITEETVRSQLFRGRKLLAEQLLTLPLLWMWS